jgi:potassium large conductance calcium-activated channel subfamily M alpha protein 1
MCACAVFIMAGLLQWVEWKATPLDVQKENSCGPHGCLTFYHANYDMIDTV